MIPTRNRGIRLGSDPESSSRDSGPARPRDSEPEFAASESAGMGVSRSEAPAKTTRRFAYRASEAMSVAAVLP